MADYTLHFDPEKGKHVDELFFKWLATDRPIIHNEIEARYAFHSGYKAAQQEPANTVEVKASQVLSRDERDALCAANAFLTILQSSVGDETVPGYRIQKVLNTISDILYG